ncbi:ATP-dependent RNA helicase MRH4 [Yarrowia sp. C11]|nr:ATP-dependent RNA helicase MRH4 [Yarrowia sp. C11]
MFVNSLKRITKPCLAVPDMAVRHIAMRPKPKVKVNSREGGGKGKPRPSTGVRRRPPGAQKQQPASIAINGDAARRLLESKFAANISSFNELKLHPDVRAVLPEVIQLPENRQDQTIKPSIIQSLAVKIMRQSYTYKQRVKNEGEEPTVEKIPVDRQKTFVLAAQTGSGKTLAYLLPLLSDLKDQEKFPSWQLEKHYKTVRSVILVPTLELSQQVGQVLKEFEEPLGIKTFASAFGQNHQEISKAFSNRLDVLVTTPQKLQQTREKNLGGATHLVVDEADTLFDTNFIDSTTDVISQMPKLKCAAFVAATVSKQFLRKLKSFYPHVSVIAAPRLHAIPDHIRFSVVDVNKPPYYNNKKVALLQALYAISHSQKQKNYVRRVVVFRNRKEHIPELKKFLEENGYPVDTLHGKQDLQERNEVVEKYTNMPEAADPSEKARNVRVLLTTDIASRGMDMKNLRFVVLYDVPFDKTDFIHRVGRTGRFGREGEVYMFTDNQDKKAQTNQLLHTSRNGLSL